MILKLNKKNVSKIFLKFHRRRNHKFKRHPKNETKQKMLKYYKKFSNTLEAKMNLFETTRNCIKDDVLKNTFLLNAYKKEISFLNNKMESVKTEYQDLHKTLALTRISLMDLEEKIGYLEKASYDSNFLWKITNVFERYQEAVSGRQTSFYSFPFYTGRYGYKMCCRIYLNGDGSGRGTHISLYFVLLKGDHDALLQWPFKHKVKFILINQSNNKSIENEGNYNEDHFDTFKADPNSNSFRRPINDMNQGSGLPQFCPLTKIFGNDNKFIKDNIMYIKVLIE